MNQHVKKSPVEDKDIEIIVIRPSISRIFLPIVSIIEFPQIQKFSERKP